MSTQWDKEGRRELATATVYRITIDAEDRAYAYGVHCPHCGNMIKSPFRGTSTWILPHCIVRRFVNCDTCKRRVKVGRGWTSMDDLVEPPPNHGPVRNSGLKLKRRKPRRPLSLGEIPQRLFETKNGLRLRRRKRP